MAPRSKPMSRSESANDRVKSSTATPPSRPPDLDKILEAAVKRIKEASRDAHHSGSIEAHWELGRVLASLQTGNTSADDAASGRMGSIRLARKLGLKPTQIKMAGYIYRAYPKPADRDRVLKMRRADDLPLGISVLARLCLPRLEGDRESLLRRACSENWSEAKVKELLGTRREGDPGPHGIGGIPKRPTTLSEAVIRWRRRADEAIRYSETVFQKEAITRLLEATDPEPVAIERIKALRGRVVEVRTAIAAELKALDRIIEHLEEVRAKEAVPASPASKPIIAAARGGKPKT